MLRPLAAISLAGSPLRLLAAPASLVGRPFLCAPSGAEVRPKNHSYPPAV